MVSYIFTWEGQWKLLYVYYCGEILSSIYFILEFHNHELGIGHTSSEDIADSDVPGIVMIALPHSPFSLMC